MQESEMATMQAVPDEVASLADTINSRPGTTIVPAETTSDGEAAQAVDELHKQAQSQGPLAARLQIESRIGKGGMGEVMLAEQRSVGRKVAVKRLPAGAATDKAVKGLLREGWVTGTLEHPNVMPLYDLGFDDEGRPLMVLKRIEGLVWRDLMNDAESVQRRFGMDLLQWNLQILVNLCNALGFAHSKRILHRDVKPDNVMIGEFGEVYLLDWGIAVSLSEEGNARLPRVSSVRELAGTPAYMAPEMLDPHPGRLGIHTDVYLLGAVLYEIITGKCPHRFSSFQEFVHSVMKSKITFSDDVPVELGDICRKAMSVKPQGRYASTDEFRLALQSFLAHRGSTELEVQARHRLRDLEELLAERAENAEPATGIDEADIRVEIYERFSECRFGFRQALQTWADNEAAKEGLREAIRAMVEYELTSGHARAAAGLLAGLDREDSADLRTRVEQALDRLRDEAEEVERLREFRKGHDRTTGRGTRRALLLSIGVLWTLTPMAAYVFPTLSLQYEALIILPVVFFASISILRVAAARPIKSSFISRSIVGALLTMLAAEIILSVAGALAGIDPATLQTLHFVPWLMTALAINMRFRRDLWFVPLCYAAGFMVAAARPDLRIAAMVFGHGAMALGSGIWALRTLGEKPR